MAGAVLGHCRTGRGSRRGHNWLTTGDHLIKTMISAPYWAVAGVDLCLLVSAGVAVWSARKLARREQIPVPPMAAEESHG